MVGVSTDPQATSDRFRDELCLPFALVGDGDGSVVRAYGVRWPLIGLARRATFLIDRDKTIKLAFESQFDIGAHLAQVSQALA